jgi:hypothetical protein
MTLLLALVASTTADRGILDLDNTTFDRVVGGSVPVMVRVDKEYPYGDSDDAWKDFGSVVGDSDAAVLIANIGVADPPSPYRGEEGRYGEGPPPDEEEDENAWRENQDLAERFGVSLEAFPKFFFFPAGWKEGTKPLPYEGEENKDGFLRFVQETADVWIGLPGQVKELHALAKSFLTAPADEKAETLATAKAATDEAGKYYAKVMSKASADAEFVAKETARLKKMMDDGSVAAAKKAQFSKRLNALSSFV